MTHQYVGAYYVPHGWYMEYDPQFQYDPLSTVFYKNAWYILKQPAPVGTEPTNSQYWAQYNMVPGQIGEIEQSVNDLQDQINELKSPNRKVLLVGDSYGEYLEKNWANQILDVYQGANVCKGGGGFTPTDYRGYINQIKTIQDLSTYTDCVIFGGSNDRGATTSVTSYVTKMAEIKQYLLLANPRMRIWLGFNEGTTSTSLMATLIDTYNAYHYAAMVNGVQWIDYGGVLNNILLLGSPDTSHPNQLGSDVLAQIVMSALNGGDWNYYYKTTVTPQTEHTSITNLPISYINRDVIFHMHNFNCTFPATTIKIDRGIQICTIPVCFILRQSTIFPVMYGSLGKNRMGDLFIQPDGRLFLFPNEQLDNAISVNVLNADITLPHYM